MDSYKEQSLNIIKDSKIFTQDDFKVIVDLQDELRDVFLYSQVFRTRTEMEVSVLNDVSFPTADSKYWQAAREQNVMFQELINLSYEYRKNQVEIKKLQRDMDKETDDLEKEFLQIEIERKEFLAISMERVAKDRIREIREWHEIKEKLKSFMKCSLTDVNEHQLVSYTKRWISELLAAGDAGSMPERYNLLGQLDKGIKMCKEKGCLDKVLAEFPSEVHAFFLNSNIGGINSASDKVYLNSAER